jgi:hypothetical protein
VNSILHRDRPENGKPIGIKRIVNEKDCYIDGKNMKTNMRYIPEFQEVSRMKVVVGGRGGGEQLTATCQILVIFYTCCNGKMSTKIIAKCSISCNEITQFT